MAKVSFPEDSITIEVEDGSRLQDAIDESGADIPFGCREGNCATCMIEVLDGMDNLNGHTSQEEVTLLPDELEQNIRLACQCVVKEGEVKVKQAEIAF
jgi:ferredoxin